TPKTSLAAVKLAIDQARRGVIARCVGLQLPVTPKVVQHGRTLTLTCDLDCTYVAQLYRTPNILIATKRGRAVGAQATTLALRVPASLGIYRLQLKATAAVNPGKAAVRRLTLRRG